MGQTAWGVLGEVRDQLLAVQDGAPIYVRDVAEVKLGFKKSTGVVRRLGESSISLNCIRESGANVLEVMEGLREVNREINQRILEPRGLQLSQVYDETDYIYSSIALVRQNIFLGGALTMIVLMVFLHLDVRTLLSVPLVVAAAMAATVAAVSLIRIPCARWRCSQHRVRACLTSQLDGARWTSVARKNSNNRRESGVW